MSFESWQRTSNHRVRETVIEHWSSNKTKTVMFRHCFIRLWRTLGWDKHFQTKITAKTVNQRERWNRMVREWNIKRANKTNSIELWVNFVLSQRNERWRVLVFGWTAWGLLFEEEGIRRCSYSSIPLHAISISNLSSKLYLWIAHPVDHIHPDLSPIYGFSTDFCFLSVWIAKSRLFVMLTSKGCKWEVAVFY